MSEKRVHREVSQEDSSRALTKWLEPKDFKWMLTGASWITEAQTYYAIGEDGTFTLVQMAYSNLTWPNTSCQITARYYRPGGPAVIHKFETQTLSALRMKMSNDYTSVTALNSSINMRSTHGDKFVVEALKNEPGELTADPTHMHVLCEVGGEETAASPLRLDFEFSPLTKPFVVGDGNVYFGVSKNDGFINIKYLPAGQVNGSVKFEGKLFPLKGQGICLHMFQGVKPHSTASRWNFAYFVEGGSQEKVNRASLYMLEMQTAEYYGKQIINYGAYYDGSRLHAVTHASNKIKYAKETKDSTSGYLIPEHFDYQWKGKDFNGNDFVATCCGTPGPRIARIDLLENVPSMLRKMLESLSNARPYVYHHFDQDVTVTVKTADGEKTMTGCLFQEFSFLHEVTQ